MTDTPPLLSSPTYDLAMAVSHAALHPGAPAALSPYDIRKELCGPGVLTRWTGRCHRRPTWTCTCAGASAGMFVDLI